MLEIIWILAGAVLLVVTPMQTAQICAGKISPKFKGTPSEYAAAFRKQLTMVAILGAVSGVINLALIFLDSEPGEWIFSLVGAGLWFGVAVVGALSARKLASLPAPPQSDGASA